MRTSNETISIERRVVHKTTNYEIQMDLVL